MKIIGITGGIGAGKSTVSEEFKKYGACIIDADKISHQVTAKNGSAYAEIVENFGTDVLKSDGEIDRKKLAGIVFSDQNELEKLNYITHKHIFEKMREEIASSDRELIILDVPLLFSADFDIKCDYKIAVVANLQERIKRVMFRDGISRDDVLKRIDAQLSDEEMREKADMCIENDSFENMRNQVSLIVDKIKG